MTQLEKYADKSMFRAAAMRSITPQVHLLWMTPDPLGAIAAASMMYEGTPVFNLGSVTDDDRRHYWSEMQKTKLKAPLEFVKLHFMIEGVTRAFTHQHVRQRTAAYAQESLRFAVKEDLASEVGYPPSLSDPGLSHSERNIRRDVWDGAIKQIEDAYRALIANGVPAEDARGLLPTNVTTRLHYVTDLRNLVEHAGNRLCTQAQYEWRDVFLGKEGLVEAIRNYRPGQEFCRWRDWDHEPYCEYHGCGATDDVRCCRESCPHCAGIVADDRVRWQLEAITDDVFTPACYQAGKCPFKADFDRGCTIRGRVEMFAKHGIPSDQWGDASKVTNGIPIRREEWLSDPKAAWVE